MRIKMPVLSDEEWIDLAKSTCDHAGVQHGTIKIITTWNQTFSHNSKEYRNNCVFHIGEGRLLKLYGPKSERAYHVEKAVLKSLTENNFTHAPQFITAGQVSSESHPYLIMTEISGDTLQNLWDSFSQFELLSLACEIGKLTKAFHRVPTDVLEEVEATFGGRKEYIAEMEADRRAEIESAESLTQTQKDSILEFLMGEALHVFDSQSVLTHSDFSHAHVFVDKENGNPKVTGFIDWGEAMVGCAEWDVTFHWFWTFSQDRPTMREYLKAHYGDTLPEHFARRCLGALFYSYQMDELWDYFIDEADKTEDIIHDLLEYFFPADVFGSPD